MLRENLKRGESPRWKLTIFRRGRAQVVDGYWKVWVAVATAPDADAILVKTLADGELELDPDGKVVFGLTSAETRTLPTGQELYVFLRHQSPGSGNPVDEPDPALAFRISRSPLENYPS